MTLLQLLAALYVEGRKERGKTTITVEPGYGLFVIRDVPAKVCELCGADWIDDAALGIL